MKPFPLSPALLRLSFGLGLVLLVGCRTSRPTASIGVSSPPPPLIGSAPISAYDDYALGVAPNEKVRVESLAQLRTR